MERLVQRILVHSHVWSARTLASIRFQAESSPDGVAFDSLLSSAGERVVLVACVVPVEDSPLLRRLRASGHGLQGFHWFDETMGSVVRRCVPGGGTYCCMDLATSAVLVCAITPELFPSMEARLGIPRARVA